MKSHNAAADTKPPVGGISTLGARGRHLPAAKQILGQEAAALEAGEDFAANVPLESLLGVKHQGPFVVSRETRLELDDVVENTADGGSFHGGGVVQRLKDDHQELNR